MKDRPRQLYIRTNVSLHKQLADLQELTGKSQSDLIHEAVERLWRRIEKTKAA